jgi:hypothetical protein
MRFICACAILACFASPAMADPFQFISGATGAFIAYAPVYVDNVFVGYTDLYGRITINPGSPPGQHLCAVDYMGQRLQRPLPIVGTTQMQVVKF